MTHYNQDERNTVNAALVGVLPLVALSVAVPPVGYTLTGAVALAAVGLIGRGTWRAHHSQSQPLTWRVTRNTTQTPQQGPPAAHSTRREVA